MFSRSPEIRLLPLPSNPTPLAPSLLLLPITYAFFSSLSLSLPLFFRFYVLSLNRRPSFSPLAFLPQSPTNNRSPLSRLHPLLAFPTFHPLLALLPRSYAPNFYQRPLTTSFSPLAFLPQSSTNTCAPLFLLFPPTCIFLLRIFFKKTLTKYSRIAIIQKLSDSKLHMGV